MTRWAPRSRQREDQTYDPHAPREQFAVPGLSVAALGRGVRLFPGAVLGRDRDADVVEVTIEGRPLFAAFVLDAAEHRRRQRLGLGPVDSTGLLHGLWLLPAFVPVLAEDLPPVKVARLRGAVGWVVETGAGFERSYSPAGRVTALAAIGAEPRRQLDRAAEQPPVFERSAIVTSGSPARVEALAVESRRRGIGLYHARGGELREIAAPAAAIVGRPGVFRWWIAELAYRAWLQESTQLVS